MIMVCRKGWRNDDNSLRSKKHSPNAETNDELDSY
jgi:hypothetical protein